MITKSRTKWGNCRTHPSLSPVSELNWDLSVSHLCHHGVLEPCTQTLPRGQPALTCRDAGLPPAAAGMCWEGTGAQTADTQFVAALHSLNSQQTARLHSHMTQKQVPGSRCLKTQVQVWATIKNISNQHVWKCIFIRTAFCTYHLPGHWNALLGSQKQCWHGISGAGRSHSAVPC